MNDLLPHTEDAQPDWIDALLRRAAPPPLSDDGFTAGVMRGLEAESPRSLRILALWHERILHEQSFARWTVGGAVAGVLIAAAAGVFTPGANLAVAAWQPGPLAALVQAWPSLLLAILSAVVALLVLDEEQGVR